MFPCGGAENRIAAALLLNFSGLKHNRSSLGGSSSRASLRVLATRSLLIGSSLNLLRWIIAGFPAFFSALSEIKSYFDDFVDERSGDLQAAKANLDAEVMQSRRP